MNLNLEYMVKIGDNPATIYYSFDGKTKMVRGVRITGNVELHQVRWVLSNAPSSEGDLIKNFQKRVGKKVIIKYVPVDITFADFWEKYGNKIGKKKRAEHLWGLLNTEERQKAIAYLDSYNSYLRQNPNITKLYPETYLSQERWNN
ncbi:hypothetical protein Cycma_0560 [Cyclobacterium marinum DSM 745]|uniref:Uncharacterized protein n=2 Tax=Cyclobacterium marinum TaxID=104 RepID=G0IY02_CYCMS|nr:hypothetical protein Cycma_0560 [Cyclobacterium marinum DSM 745]